jgi:hypothetical protein
MTIGKSPNYLGTHMNTITLSFGGKVIRMPCSTVFNDIEYVSSQSIARFIYDIGDESEHCKSDILRFVEHVQKYRDDKKSEKVGKSKG